jgi:hypothetical protein
MNTIYLTIRGIKDLKKKISQLEHQRNTVVAELHESDKT